MLYVTHATRRGEIAQRLHRRGMRQQRRAGERRTKIGAAFPHKEGHGFSIELKAVPLDGRLVVLPPDSNNNRYK